MRTENGQLVCDRDLLVKHFGLSEDEVPLVQDVICTEDGQALLNDMVELFGISELQGKVRMGQKIIVCDFILFYFF